MNIPITGRPYLDREMKLVRLHPDHVGEETLGLLPEELKYFVTAHGGNILEIGPGFGESTLDFESLGLKVTAVEPGLKSRAPDRARIQEAMEELGLRARVLAISARELKNSWAIKNSSMAVAIAIGANFQTYSVDGQDLVAGIVGIMSKVRKDGFLAFEIDQDENGVPIVNCTGTRWFGRQGQVIPFYIHHFLDALSVSHTVDIREGSRTSAIRIFRTNQQTGEDAVRTLSQADNQTIKQYEG